MKNWLLIILLVCIVALPLVLNRNAEYGGADGAAMDQILATAPDYKPWFASLWEPPSGEVESLLFAVQASAGTGFIAYYFGLMRGRRQGAGDRQNRPPQ